MSNYAQELRCRCGPGGLTRSFDEEEEFLVHHREVPPASLLFGDNQLAKLEKCVVSPQEQIFTLATFATAAIHGTKVKMQRCMI
jgi:hypothetical protein